MPSAKHRNVTALAGGVGASKLLLGLYGVMDPRDLTVIVNTGDDIALHGLKISPDLDIVTYTLAGIVDAAKGWGYRGETFHALKRLAAFGRIHWFNLGDRDLATHIHRSAILAEGKTLSDAAEAIRLLLTRERSAGKIFNLVDDQPVLLSEFYRWLAAKLNRPLPPVGRSTSKRKRGESNKRVSNAKLRAIDWVPRYPSFAEGMERSVLPNLDIENA